MEVDTPEQRPQDTPAAQTPPAQPESQPAHAGGNPSATLAGAAIVEEELDTYLNPVSRETDGVILHDNDICYTVTPVVSAGHPCSVYCVAATRNMRWVYTGGDDGFIRKFDFVPSMNGDYPLPLNQRHGLADSIIRGGLLISAWENEETLPRPNAADSAPTENRISPVYSIDVHSEGAWVVTGCESGAINMWTGRHDEGTCFHTLQHHKNSVSVLKITPDETGLFSGSWDKSVLRWDLNVGRVVREFSGASSQITSISLRPTPNTGTGLPSRSTESILMCTSFDGCIGIFDERVPGRPQIRKILPQGSPPWALSACWSNDGKRIYCGRRNGTVDEYDFAEGKILRTLRLPRDSGAVSQVNIMPNDRHLLCASYDNIRLWDLQASESKPTAADSSVPSTPNAANPVTQSNRRLDFGDSACPFTIVPGHHGGVLSSLYIDASRKYLISASGARGWDGVSTNMCLFYDVKPQRHPNASASPSSCPATNDSFFPSENLLQNEIERNPSPNAPPTSSHSLSSDLPQSSAHIPHQSLSSFDQIETMMDAVDVVGYVYCPPGWDEQRLRSGPDAEAIGQIAVSTYTDIAYIKEKNAIQISGETHDDVYQAQNKLNALFFPVIVKSKRQWARPDRPGVWGQRRDSTNGGNANGGAGANNNNNPSNGNNTANGGNGGNGGEPQQNGGRGIRKMRSESSLRPQSQQPQPYGAPASQTHGWK